MSTKKILFFYFLFALQISAQWQLMKHPYDDYGYVYNLASNVNFIFALIGQGNGNNTIYRSSDNGLLWQQADFGLPTKGILKIVIKKNFLFVGVYKEGVFRSNDNGDTWIAVNNGISDLWISDISIQDDTLYAVSRSDLMRSTDNGDNWEKICANPFVGIVRQFIVNESAVILCTGGSGIWISADNYNSWRKYGFGWASPSVSRILSFDQNIFVGASSATFPSGPFYYGSFVSTNNGQSWAQITDDAGEAFLKIGDYVYVARYHKGIYRTRDFGKLLDPFNEGIQINSSNESVIGTFSVNDSSFFAGGSIISTNGVALPAIWYISLSKVTDVNSLHDIPPVFSLYQNFPNPFNPETTIKYSLPKATNVTMKVFDFLGRDVVTLVDEYKQPGNYSVKLSTNYIQLSSGVYFYRLQTEDFVETKKFILLK